MIDVTANPSDAVEKALEKFGNDILRLAYSYMKSREDAEDVVQDVLIRFMQSEKQFNGDEHVKAWLLRVAANLCKDRLKLAWRQREVAIPEGYDVPEENEVSAERNDILEIVMSLPEKYRSVIHLYYYEEYSIKEIAAVLEKKETTVKTLLKRGREKLANEMASDNERKGENSYAERI